MAAPVGAVVRLAPFDMTDGEPGPEHGDYLVSNGGTVYVVLHSQPSRRPDRYALSCLKVGSVESVSLPDDARIIPLQWYPRHRK